MTLIYIYIYIYGIIWVSCGGHLPYYIHVARSVDASRIQVLLAD